MRYLLGRSNRDTMTGKKAALIEFIDEKRQVLEGGKAVELPFDRKIAMNQPNAFADALDAVEQLDADAQAELLAVLNRRLAERGRERVAAAVAQARREFAAGQCQAMTPAEIVHEAQS